MPTIPTQFIILVGMLGSGKTSLLEELLKNDMSASTAIIVNEVGAINIDGAILSESARGLSMVTLSNGCVCCSLADDLATTVEELVVARSMSGQKPFERIVLECSGLARPGAVMSSLGQLSRLGLNAHIVATYDCLRPPLACETLEDVVSQLGAAHIVVLTKVDLASATQRMHARNDIMEINPHVRVIGYPALARRARAAFIDAIPSADQPVGCWPAFIASRRLLHPHIRVFSATFSELAEWDEALDWLEAVAGTTGDRLLRSKAIVPGPHGRDRVLIQSVGTTFSAPRRLMNPAFDGKVTAIFTVRDCRLIEVKTVKAKFEVTWTELQHLDSRFG
jgi:G3E family GTPase